MRLAADDLVHIATGAAFLGTGGGGDPYIGRLLAINAVERFGVPTVIEADALADDASVFTIAMLGVPTVLGEKAACGDDVDLAVRRLEQRLGRTADALIGLEIGGLNSLLPVMAAARLGLPLVDADGMGRAFPELQMTTFNVGGVSCTPLAVTDDHLKSIVVDTADAKSAEDLVRVASVHLGCSVVLSSYPMTGADVKRTAVKGTLTLAREIGRAIERGRREGDPVQTLVDYLRTTPYYNHCKVLFDGKVQDIRRETKLGFSIGHCRLAALNRSGSVMEISFQNEHLVARLDGIGQGVRTRPNLPGGPRNGRTDSGRRAEIRPASQGDRDQRGPDHANPGIARHVRSPGVRTRGVVCTPGGCGLTRGEEK